MKVSRSNDQVTRDVKAPTVSHIFPIQVTQSVRFQSSGAVIDKATISVRGRVLSTIVPTPLTSSNDTLPDQGVALDFFKEKAFHGALVPVDDVRITLYVSDGCTPSLIICVLTENLTWEKVGGSIHKEEVCAGSDSGEVVKTLIYSSDGNVGYLRQ